MSRHVYRVGEELHVTFPYTMALKDLVKALPGSRWSQFDRVWLFPVARAAAVVPVLVENGFVATAEVLALVDRGDNPALAATVPIDADLIAPDALSVRALNAQVAAVLRERFARAVQVVGEIDGFRPRGDSTHVWFDLVERDADGNDVASVTAVMFATTRARINRRMADHGLTLQNGLRVLLVVRMDLFERNGRFQLVVDDIDPAYTVGDIVGRREAVVRALAAEGLLERNRSLVMPRLPLRIALVTSRESDAFHDVVSILKSSGYAFVVTVFDVRVQGTAVEDTVTRALALVEAYRRRFDVCLITRGGGSRVELGAFDNVVIGRAVARLSVKVLVAIGHQQDVSALDALAESRRTPTDAATSLVEMISEAEQRVEQAWLDIDLATREMLFGAAQGLREFGRRLDMGCRDRLRQEREFVEHVAVSRIRLGVQRRVARSRSRLDRAQTLLSPARLRRLLLVAKRLHATFRQRLERGVSKRVADAQGELATLERRTARAPRSVLEAQQVQLKNAATRLRLLEPSRVLARGYSIVRSEAGQAITGVARLAGHERVTIVFADGTAGASITHTNASKTQEPSDD